VAAEREMALFGEAIGLAWFVFKVWTAVELLKWAGWL
jgi:hypothetical protein